MTYPEALRALNAAAYAALRAEIRSTEWQMVDRQSLREICKATDKLVDGLPDGARRMTVDIDEIEARDKRWHGEEHRIAAVRWEPYKPDGRRQMGVKGRWQEMQVTGDWHRWVNCERPQNLRMEPKP
jgi:hypothetical protein